MRCKEDVVAEQCVEFGFDHGVGRRNDHPTFGNRRQTRPVPGIPGASWPTTMSSMAARRRKSRRAIGFALMASTRCNRASGSSRSRGSVAAICRGPPQVAGQPRRRRLRVARQGGSDHRRVVNAGIHVHPASSRGDVCAVPDEYHVADQIGGDPHPPGWYGDHDRTVGRTPVTRVAICTAASGGSGVPSSIRTMTRT